MNENMTVFDPEACLAELRPEDTVTISTEEYEDTVTISTEEYKALIRNSTMLELIHRVTAEAKYGSEIEQICRITMKMTGWPEEAVRDEI